MRADAVPRGTGNLKHIGDIQLALGVIGVEFLEGIGKHAPIKGENAGIDLIDLALFFGGILLLHDGRHAAILSANDAAVTGRVIEAHREHSDRVALLGVGGAQTLDGLWGKQWDIAVGDNDGSLEVRNRLQAAGHRMTGAQLLLLHRLQYLAVQLLGDGIHGGGDLIALVAHHRHDALRVDPGRSMQSVAEQGATANLMQGLLLGGLHAGAGASRKDDDSTRGCCYHGLLNSWGSSLILIRTTSYSPSAIYV